MAVKNCFIRGSVVRYVQLPPEHVDTQLLEDATRRGTSFMLRRNLHILYNIWYWMLIHNIMCFIIHRGC